MKRSSFFIFFTLILGSKEAWAFDPLGVSAVIGVVSSIADSGSEISGTVSAFEELYSEISPDSQMSAESSQLLSEIQELESLAKEVGYTSDEIAALGYSNDDEAKSLSSVLRKMTSAIRAGKRVSKLFQKLDTRAKAAQIESSETQKQQLAGIYRLIRLQQKSNLNDAKKELRNLKEKRDQVKQIKRNLAARGAQSFGKMGVLSFPKQNEVIETSISIAVKMRPYLCSLILLILLVKVVGYQFTFQINANYEELIKNVILSFLLLSIYPELIRGSIALCQGLYGVFGKADLQSVSSNDPTFAQKDGWSLDLKVSILHLFEWLKYLFWLAADFISTFVLSFIILILPIGILMNQMLGFSSAFHVSYGLILALSLWPVFWNLIGMMTTLVWKNQEDSVKSMIFGVFFALAQFGSPLIALKVFGADSLAGSALKPVSRAIQRLIQPVQGLYQNMKKQGWGAVNAAQGIRGGGAGGRMLGWMGNQIASRTQNAWSSARGARDPEISDSQPIRPSSPNFRANAAIRGFIFNRDQSVPSEEKSNIGMRLARGFKHQRLSASKAIKL